MLPDLIGRQIAQFEIEELLGAGGMGVVYAAKDTRLNCRRALKFLSTATADMPADRARLLGEARAVAGLEHANICTVHDICEVDEHLFIVMSLIEGEPLYDRIAAARLGQAEAVHFALQVAAGLKAAQQRDVVHRDIKPGNLMVAPDNSIKIMDFGLASCTGAVDDDSTQSSAGTTPYMSPEQTQGEAVDGRTDIWALGVVLYEMLTGSLPFVGTHGPAVQYSICHEPHRSLGALRGGLNPDLERIVDRCLEKDPELRYQTAADLKAELHHLEVDFDHTGRAGVDDAVPQTPDRKRPRIALPLILLILALILFLPEHFLVSGMRLPREKHLAVLPIMSLSENGDNHDLSNGLVQFLTSRLTQLEKSHTQLRVIPASVIWRNRIADPVAARQIGATLVVDGCLQRNGQKIRLILNLIDTDNQRQIDSALIEYELADIFTFQDKALIKLSEMLAVELDVSEARTLVAAGTATPDAQLLYLEGLGALQNLLHLRPLERVQRIEAALELIRQALDLDPTNATALAALGEASWRMYEAVRAPRWAEEAQRYCDRALLLDERNPRIHLTRGLVLTGAGRYDEAIASFERVLELDARNADAFRELGCVYRVTSRPERAEAILRQAIELRPDDWLGYEELGLLQFRVGAYDSAAARFGDIIELTPDNYIGHAWLGGVCQMIPGREDEGAEHLRRSIAINPNSAAYNNLGYHYSRSGLVAEAAEAFRRSTELNPNDYRVWGNLGSQYDRLPGMAAKAESSFRHAVELAEEQLAVNPDDTGVFGPLGSYYVELQEREKGKALLERLLLLAPDDVNQLFQAGHTFEQLGMRERALECLGRALELGYPRERIESAVWLEDLIEDPRYTALQEKE
ncbi:MAG: protein kinase [bacterium]|nr:protein kinase [bacterium]